MLAVDLLVLTLEVVVVVEPVLQVLLEVHLVLDMVVMEGLLILFHHHHPLTLEMDITGLVEGVEVLLDLVLVMVDKVEEEEDLLKILDQMDLQELLEQMDLPQEEMVLLVVVPLVVQEWEQFQQLLQTLVAAVAVAQVGLV